MCPSWDTCCAQHGQEHLFPCLPHLVHLRPILGLLLKAPDLHAVGLAYVPRKLPCAHRRAGGVPDWGPAGQFWLSQPEERCGCSGHSRFSPSSPEVTSWPLISVSWALGAVSMAFVALMCLWCGRAGVLTRRWLSAQPIAQPYLECGSAAGSAGSAAGSPALPRAGMQSLSLPCSQLGRNSCKFHRPFQLRQTKGKFILSGGTGISK